MALEITINKTIQTGDGSNKDFDFAFEIPDEDSLSLTKRNSDGSETTISSNYTVTGIGNSAGGSVNYPTTGSALTSSEKIIIKRVVSLTQRLDLRNQGDYSLEDIEDALDRDAMICQQLQEQIDRCLKLNLTSSSTYNLVDDFVANRLLVVAADGQSIEMSSAEYGSIDAYLSTLTAIADDISAVATIADDVTTVADISSEITTIAEILPDNLEDIQNAASFGFPTLIAGDANKFLRVNSEESGYAVTTDLYNPNMLRNGCMRVAQRGTSFTYATTPANDRGEYLIDGWLLSTYEDNEQVNVSIETTVIPDGSYAAMKLDQEITNGRWGIFQILSATDSAKIINQTTSLSFKARKGANNSTIGTLRAAIISWTGTADAPTPDPVIGSGGEAGEGGGWATGYTNPGLKSNYTYESTPSDLTLTDTYQTFKIEGVSIDASDVKNVGVMIWCHDMDGAAGDIVYITDIKLEEGDIATSYNFKPYCEELSLCQFWYRRLGGNCPAVSIGTTSVRLIGTFEPMRITPTITLLTTSPIIDFFNTSDGTGASSTITTYAANERCFRINIDGFTGLTSDSFGRMSTYEPFEFSCEF